jgi:hypothetical protein
VLQLKFKSQASDFSLIGNTNFQLPSEIRIFIKTAEQKNTYEIQNERIKLCGKILYSTKRQRVKCDGKKENPAKREANACNSTNVSTCM